MNWVHFVEYRGDDMICRYSQSQRWRSVRTDTAWRLCSQITDSVHSFLWWELAFKMNSRISWIEWPTRIGPICRQSIWSESCGQWATRYLSSGVLIGTVCSEIGFMAPHAITAYRSNVSCSTFPQRGVLTRVRRFRLQRAFRAACLSGCLRSDLPEKKPLMKPISEHTVCYKQINERATPSLDGVCIFTPEPVNSESKFRSE